MIEVQIDMKPLERYLKKLEEDVLMDLRPFWQDQAEDSLKDAFTELFDNEGRIGQFQSWVPLSPRYAAVKARTHPGRGILERTGALRRSLTQTPNVQIARHEMQYSTSIPYAVYHEHGAGFLPERPMASRVASVIPDVLQRELSTYLKQKIRRRLR